MRVWATTDALGEISYGWKKEAVKAAKPIGGNVVRCDMGPLHGQAWIVLLGVIGSDAGEQWLVACDGRRIPVLVGSSLVVPYLIGLRGGTPKQKYADAWRRIQGEIYEQKKRRCTLE